MLLRVRRATTEDVALLMPLVKDYWAFEGISGFDPPRVSAQLTQLLSEPDLGCGWLALADDVPIGYLLAVYVFSLEHFGRTAEIDEFFLLPQNRGRGIGARLIEIAESTFIRAGCTNVSLRLSRQNDSGRAFYRRHGYAERSEYELLDKALRESRQSTPVAADLAPAE